MPHSQWLNNLKSDSWNFSYICKFLIFLMFLWFNPTPQSCRWNQHSLNWYIVCVKWSHPSQQNILSIVIFPFPSWPHNLWWLCLSIFSLIILIHWHTTCNIFKVSSYFNPVYFPIAWFWLQNTSVKVFVHLSSFKRFLKLPICMYLFFQH